MMHDFWNMFFAQLMGPGPNQPGMIRLNRVSDTSGTMEGGWKFQETIFENKEKTIREVRRIEYFEESPVTALKIELRRAIEDENYEEAARIRDEIQQRETKDEEE